MRIAETGCNTLRMHAKRHRAAGRANWEYLVVVLCIPKSIEFGSILWPEAIVDPPVSASR